MAKRERKQEQKKGRRSSIRSKSDSSTTGRRTAILTLTIFATALIVAEQSRTIILWEN
jgi:hypothetical protein